MYKYFGQLELLELRFAEIRVNFPWRDAFTNKLTTQTSIAYEKACIIFQIAATHSAIAASQNRSDPEGLKRAFYYFRTCAGMLTYINENFLHAPSTDLSREVIKFLVGVILAQATEVFFEKCTDEKKGNTLIAKIAAQAAFMYTGLAEEVKEFMGKGIFDRNWVTVIQVSAVFPLRGCRPNKVADQSKILYFAISILPRLGGQCSGKARRSPRTIHPCGDDSQRSEQERLVIRICFCHTNVPQSSPRCWSVPRRPD